MRFNRHPELSGKHAFLSPSSPYWLRYDPQKLEASFYKASSAKRGTDLHALACESIRLGVRIHESNKALAYYVNDCIEWGMVPEQLLYYSPEAFGTADAIRFDQSYFDIETHLLRISDYKSGVTATKMEQLEVYAGLFFLEYGYDPFTTKTECRIYQRDEVWLHEPSPEGIVAIMDTIVQHVMQIEELKEALS